MDAVVWAIAVGCVGLFAVFVAWDVLRRRTESHERMHALTLVDRNALAEVQRLLKEHAVAIRGLQQPIRATSRTVSLEADLRG